MNTAAAIFYLKTEAGWDDGTEVDLIESELLAKLDKVERTGERELIPGLCSGPCKLCGMETGDFWALPGGDSEWECGRCCHGR